MKHWFNKLIISYVIYKFTSENGFAPTKELLSKSNTMEKIKIIFQFCKQIYIQAPV